MATANEDLTSVQLLNSTSSITGTVAFTVPAGKYAEVYPQYVSGQFNLGGGNPKGFIKVGETSFPLATDPGGASSVRHYYATDVHDAGVSAGPSQVMQMGRAPITIDQGQTITHNISGFGNANSTIVAVIKLYNRP